MLFPTNCIPNISGLELSNLKKILPVKAKKNLFVPIKKIIILHLVFNINFNSKFLLVFNLPLTKNLLYSGGVSIFKNLTSSFGVLLLENIFFTKQKYKLLSLCILVSFFQLLTGLRHSLYLEIVSKHFQIKEKITGKKNLRGSIFDSIFGDQSCSTNLYFCFFDFCFFSFKNLSFKTSFILLRKFFSKINLFGKKKSNFSFLANMISFKILQIFSKKFSSLVVGISLNLEKSLFGKKYHKLLKFFCQKNLINRKTFNFLFEKKTKTVLFPELEKSVKLRENYSFFKEKKILHQKNIFLGFKKIFCLKYLETESWNISILLGLFLKKSQWKKIFLYPIISAASKQDPLGSFWKFLFCLISNPMVLFKTYFGGIKPSGIYLGKILKNKIIQQIFRKNKTYFFEKIFTKDFLQSNPNFFIPKISKTKITKTLKKINLGFKQKFLEFFFFKNNLRAIQIILGLNESCFFLSKIRNVSRYLFLFFSKILKWKVFRNSVSFIV